MWRATDSAVHHVRAVDEPGMTRVAVEHLERHVGE